VTLVTCSSLCVVCAHFLQGVGKTLQSIVALALSVVERRHQLARALCAHGSSSSAFPASCVAYLPLPSLVLCPSTLLHHWACEFGKFIDPHTCPLQIIVYQGSSTEKAAIRTKLMQTGKNHHPNGGSVDSRDPIVLMSYESIRQDAGHFADLAFHHLILDEGHLIKNSASQLCRSIKSLRSISRLLLTGTPLSNHVLDLWSLFDFLMPGYLASEKAFRHTFAQPIQKARTIELEKSTTYKANRMQGDESDARHSAILSAGNVALEALHRRVLPFLLRRVKADVLADLPPKIVQDYHVDLSPLQQELYQLIQGTEDELIQQVDSIGTHGHPIVCTTAAVDAAAYTSADAMHTFQALHYLRKLCSHPALVFTPQHPQYRTLQQKYFSPSTSDSIHALHHAPKLVALKEILIECGIGTTIDGAADGEGERSAEIDTRRTQEGQQSKRKRTKSKDATRTQDGPADLSTITSIGSILPRHRVLIFAQLKSTLDRVEQDLFNAATSNRTHTDGFTPGSVSFLRLDGSTVPSRRFLSTI
jgi:TATA-binding protein-associated factor